MACNTCAEKKQKFLDTTYFLEFSGMILATTTDTQRKVRIRLNISP